MSDIAMSNETDLDWLARNVHVWPDIVPGRAFAAAFVSDGAVEWIEYSPVDWSGCYHKHQWLARRAELQNKPSFADHPDAKCLVQNDTGTWFKNTKSCRVTHSGDGGWFDEDMAGGWIEIGRGEVLGDWRDTLEMRINKFQPFTSIEDKQEQEMKQDNGWFERGELPPIGARVNVDGSGLVYGDGEKDCEVLTHVENTAVVRMSYGLGCFEANVMSPSRTERELAIEHMQSDIAERWANCEELAKHLIDKGWTKVAE